MWLSSCTSLPTSHSPLLPLLPLLPLHRSTYYLHADSGRAARERPTPDGAAMTAAAEAGLASAIAASDVWLFGSVMAELYLGEPPQSYSSGLLAHCTASKLPAYSAAPKLLAPLLSPAPALGVATAADEDEDDAGLQLSTSGVGPFVYEPFAAAAARRADAAAAAAAAAGPLPASSLPRRKPLSERARAKDAREALVQASARRPSDGAAARLPSRAYPHLQPPELAEAAGDGLPLPPSPLHLPPLLHLPFSILSTDAKPPFLIDLIGACLEPHPAHRPTVHDLLGSSHFALDARALLYAKRNSSRFLALPSQFLRNSTQFPKALITINFLVTGTRSATHLSTSLCRRPLGWWSGTSATRWKI